MRSSSLSVRQAPFEDTKPQKSASHHEDQLRCLRHLLHDGKSFAFHGKGSVLYIVRPGETVDGRVQVTAIDAASVKLVDPSTSQETTLLLPKVNEGQS